MEKFLSGIFVFVTVILLPSCTYYFQLDDVAESPKLVMYSYPGSGDTTIVRLSRSLQSGHPVYSKRYTGQPSVDSRFLTRCTGRKSLSGYSLSGWRLC